MKARIIKNVCERIVEMALFAGIFLLSQKGIMPIGIITLFFLAGGIASLLFIGLGFILKIAFLWLIITPSV